MASQTRLIFCAAYSKIFATIAVAMGLLYGARLPDKPTISPVYFADQDWKNPDRQKYMKALATYRPAVATVLDLERPGQLSEVLGWAEEAAQYVSEAIIVIPKYRGAIEQIPERIGGKEVILGYSVPTGYGATTVPFEEFGSRPVHLLGGAPHWQLLIATRLNVVSADTNFMQKAAQYHMVWNFRTTSLWTPLKKLVGGKVTGNTNYLTFAITIHNIVEAWRVFDSGGELTFMKKRMFRSGIERLAMGIVEESGTDLSSPMKQLELW